MCSIANPDKIKKKKMWVIFVCYFAFVLSAFTLERVLTYLMRSNLSCRGFLGSLVMWDLRVPVREFMVSTSGGFNSLEHLHSGRTQEEDCGPSGPLVYQL